MTIEELLEQSNSEGLVVVRRQESGEKYPELRSGRALTRYFTYAGETYLAFEELPESLRSAFTRPGSEDQAT